MKELLNGSFYNLLSCYCTLSFPHDRLTFDWIPFWARVQLMILLDQWKAAVDRRENIRTYGTRIGEMILDEQARFDRFWCMLQNVYVDAVAQKKLAERHGLLRALEPDVGFWQIILEKEIYKARKAAGEPVLFIDGHCCIDASLHDGLWICPGPYPGLEYYCHYGEFEPNIELIRSLSENGENRPKNYGQRYLRMEKDGDFALYGFNRGELLKEGVIGPATFAERMSKYFIYR